MHPRYQPHVAQIAAAQHGLVTIAQLEGLGMGRSTVSRWVAAGRLHRRHRGVYDVGHRASGERAGWMAAVMAGGAGAVLSGAAAASLWGVWRRPVRRVDVITTRQIRAPRTARYHRVAELDALDRSVIDDLPVTALSRSLVDLTQYGSLNATRLANVMHEAAYRELLDIEEIRASLARVGGRSTNRTVELAIAMHLMGSSGTRSMLEEQVLALVLSAGLPTPLINVRVALDGTEYELDEWWPVQRICVEVDGGGHRRPRSQREDALRNESLRRAGVRWMRITGEDMQRRRCLMRQRLIELHAPARQPRATRVGSSSP